MHLATQIWYNISSAFCNHHAERTVSTNVSSATSVRGGDWKVTTGKPHQNQRVASMPKQQGYKEKGV
jgi:hypothetical protein